jgi:hypothetical protein
LVVGLDEVRSRIQIRPGCSGCRSDVTGLEGFEKYLAGGQDTVGQYDEDSNADAVLAGQLQSDAGKAVPSSDFHRYNSVDQSENVPVDKGVVASDNQAVAQDYDTGTSEPEARPTVDQQKMGLGFRIVDCGCLGPRTVGADSSSVVCSDKGQGVTSMGPLLGLGRG